MSEEGTLERAFPREQQSCSTCFLLPTFRSDGLLLADGGEGLVNFGGEVAQGAERVVELQNDFFGFGKLFKICFGEGEGKKVATVSIFGHLAEACREGQGFFWRPDFLIGVGG